MTYVREQTSAELAEHIRSLKKMAGWFDPLSDRLWQEVEALQAEVSVLKAGYEAYERVNAEQKAEIGSLRKGAARYEWLRLARSGYIEVVEWIGPHATGMTGEDLDALLDAAMGKGEQL
ncbi:hypothetical protein [Pseudomonas canadensis]|uniref:hypothetical protein n=1 Tax=Pseudomonas canadensis TaxID=915099 RepID=UPI00041F200A|nr:hypothetical protein [Pseudomonas canadensis]